MGTLAKPDSSHASTYLTRRNFRGKHLLSTFQDRDESLKAKEEEKTKEENEENEDDILAPPASSSDEDDGDQEIKKDLSDDSDNEKKTHTPRKGIDEKLAENGKGLRRSGRGSQIPQPDKGSGKKEPVSPKTGMKRKSSQRGDDEEGDLFASSMRTTKKSKQIDYGAKKSNTFKARGPKVPLSSSTESLSENQSTDKVEFKMPKKIDVLSPVEKPKPEFKEPGSSDEARSPEKPKPEFKEPPLANEVPSSSMATSVTLDSFVADSDEESPLTSPASSSPASFDLGLSHAESVFINKATEEEAEETKGSLCPMCREPVDPGLLMKFQAQPRQRIRDQERFCESHKKSSAEKEWKEKGYPNIDWDTFDDRISRHFAELEKIMVPNSSSHYRSILENTMKSGKARNFRLTLVGDGLETISCGYYGTRGAGKMLQSLTSHFSKQLRLLAAEDHIVKTAGVAGYAQSVLVPELAVRLVKEDMSVEDESARDILRDSIDLGEKLNFALDDVVPVTKDESDKYKMIE